MMKAFKEFILVEEPKNEERKSEGGVILPQEKVDYSRPVKGTVLSMGSKVTGIQVGNNIYYMPKSGVELDPESVFPREEGEGTIDLPSPYVYRMIKEENVIGIED